MRKLTTEEKKANGSFNVTRDADRDFSILEGLLQMVPTPPDDFTEKMRDHWNRAYRHLVKHNYGKEIDSELVEALCREWADYLRYHKDIDTKHLSTKALASYKLMSDALCLNPNALGRAALISKQATKQKGLKELTQKRDKVG